MNIADTHIIPVSFVENFSFGVGLPHANVFPISFQNALSSLLLIPLKLSIFHARKYHKSVLGIVCLVN